MKNETEEHKENKDDTVGTNEKGDGKYQYQRDDEKFGRSNKIVDDEISIQSPESKKEEDVIKILRTVTGPLDHMDMSDHRIFSNCRGIPIDMPDEDFLPPNECQRKLSYRY